MNDDHDDDGHDDNDDIDDHDDDDDFNLNDDNDDNDDTDDRHHPYRRFKTNLHVWKHTYTFENKHVRLKTKLCVSKPTLRFLTPNHRV